MDASTLGWLVMDTSIGPLLLAGTESGLVKVGFHTDERAAGPVLRRLGERLDAVPEPGAVPCIPQAAQQLAEYFAGRRKVFDLPLDWSLSSGFNLRVLRALDATVPYGAVVGYQDLAERVGEPGAAQAVGRAMGSNPLPVVVACHRVVESDGGLGGFGGGLETKRRLLALEGVLPEPLF
ncbi:methylated-DNA--[protein]-cysteine S-methyltransferase [Streptomyces smaragdinus]|nr:methylated-DNA--[protein]-cysteine S-methyltransferase [Streptomyces smaragdinus]